jgi:hypothetical protein
MSASDLDKQLAKFTELIEGCETPFAVQNFFLEGRAKIGNAAFRHTKLAEAKKQRMNELAASQGWLCVCGLRHLTAFKDASHYPVEDRVVS